MSIRRSGLWALGSGLWALGFWLWALSFALCVHSTELKAQSRSAPDSQTIVFVCEHGTVKSVLALVYFTRMAREKGLPFRAVSRGTAPDSVVPGFMLAGLKRDGFDIGAFKPTGFSERDLASAIGVISFDRPNVARVVAGRVPSVAWDKLPSVTANYAVARDSIKRRVAQLVDSLARSRHQRR
jgi:arsenate reductase